eukprot:scaffold317_cov260-Pinguiococcus_pyrenoidosus.AAC.53
MGGEIQVSMAGMSGVLDFAARTRWYGCCPSSASGPHDVFEMLKTKLPRPVLFSCRTRLSALRNLQRQSAPKGNSQEGQNGSNGR